MKGTVCVKNAPSAKPLRSLAARLIRFVGKARVQSALRLGIVLAAMAAIHADATLYNINRSFTDTHGSRTATLTGTLELPVGSYEIRNQGSSPFTDVNLTLTVSGASFHLAYALTGLIYGTGTFYITATPTQLAFRTANAGSTNPADLVFSSNPADPFANPRYVIGWNGLPGFEVAYTPAGTVMSGAAFDTAFGTAATGSGVVPEPSTCLAGALLLIPCAFHVCRKLRK